MFLNHSSPATPLTTWLWRLISVWVPISALTPPPHIPASRAYLFAFAWGGMFLHMPSHRSHVVERHRNGSFMSPGSWNHPQSRWRTVMEAPHGIRCSNGYCNGSISSISLAKCAPSRNYAHKWQLKSWGGNTTYPKVLESEQMQADSGGVSKHGRKEWHGVCFPFVWLLD